MIAKSRGKTCKTTYYFEPGPRYCVTDIKGVKQIDIRFTEIGANGKPIDGRVKEKTLR